MKMTLKELSTQLSMFDLFTIFKDKDHVAFLDSSRDAKDLGRYSILGINPYLIFKGRENNCIVNGELIQSDPFELLRKLMKQYKVSNESELPFIGGCIGYFSYDFGLTLDRVQHQSLEEEQLPHYYFIFYDNFIICDHLTGRKYLSACGVLDEANRTTSQLEHIIKNQSIGFDNLNENVNEENIITRNRKKEDILLQASTKNPEARFTSNFTQLEYEHTVTQMKEYIRSGDIYIANLTQRMKSATNKSSYEIYRDLRQINPAPFSSYLKLESFEIISSSPECFLKLENKRVETRPIKGTRPRGETEEQDEQNRLELINSEKDRAELLMIVDLQRNDLSKVCKPGSVKVTELFKLEEYSTVFHLVSTVEGQLKDEVDSLECMKQCFPGGSITGTPKIRAMEIIDELEGIKRGIYTGCIGYFGFDGNADFNIAIRTIIKRGNEVSFGVGGGITWDSEEAAEYQETLDKAKALMRVV
ncbi:MAG: aminodeoxychorismate synthase, component [Herbinix sp.]|jgi:para-aminobenzoate synthetase component 1|nr:aminodeoxychorismate synthase, component [Herbinix sp.]